MGELLDALFITHGHHELGFSSIGAYVEERAGESARWGRESRAVARRLRERGLGHLRGALASGLVSWSMAELLSRHAQAETEVELIRRSLGRTVRSLQVELTAGSDAAPHKGARTTDEDAEPRARRRWVTRGDLAMLHTSRMLVSYLSNQHASDELLMTALLGEGESSLATFRERLGRSPSAEPVEPAGHRLKLAKEALLRWTELTSALQTGPDEDMGTCRAEGAAVPPPLPEPLTPLGPSVLPSQPAALDRAITRLAGERARRDLELAELALEFVARHGWRRLGFASLDEYAATRPGLSASGLEHKATLARRLACHPLLAQALESGLLGTEAALLLGRVLGRAAEPALTLAWLERSRSRTYGCLREEVSLVLMALSFDPSASRWPPGSEDLEAARQLERRVQSGELLRSLLGAHALGPQTSVTLVVPDPALAQPEKGENQRVPPLRLRLSDELVHHWRTVEAEFRRLVGPEPSFLAFMCMSLWVTWLPFLEAWEDKWAEVYQRDRHRCRNPVCRRRDLTPHHIVFQAHGGGDDPENVISLCSWCHLRGVHEGRIKVEGRASELRWTIGRHPVVRVVRGRRRQPEASAA